MADIFQNCREVDEFEKINRVGEGTYGVVYRAKDRKSREIVALKRVRMEKEETGLPISSLREITVLKGLRHPNIVNLKDVVVGRELDSIFLVMEYCEQDLATLIDSMRTPYTASEVKCLMRQLLLGVEYCHDHFIIHRDLKLSNLLLTSKGILKIADFGLARVFSRPFESMTPKVVTLWYRAPELLFGTSQYTTAIDLWSVGCIFGEFLNHAPLIPGKDEISQIEMITELLGAPNEQIWPGFNQLRHSSSIVLPRQPFNSLKLKFQNVSAATIDLLNRFMTYNPAKRITASEALQHSYFSEKPLAKDPDLMPTFPEIRNEQYEAARKRRHHVEEKAKGNSFYNNGNFGSFSGFQPKKEEAFSFGSFPKRRKV